MDVVGRAGLDLVKEFDSPVMDSASASGLGAKGDSLRIGGMICAANDSLSSG